MVLSIIRVHQANSVGMVTALLRSHLHGCSVATSIATICHVSACNCACTQTQPGYEPGYKSPLVAKTSRTERPTHYDIVVAAAKELCQVQAKPRLLVPFDSMAIWGSSGGTVGKTLRYLDLNWSIHHLKGWRGKSFSLDLWFSTMIFYHIYHWWRGKSWKITWIHSSHDFLPRYRGFQLQWSITNGILGCCLCLLIQGQVMFWKEQTCAKRAEEWWAQIEIWL